MSRTLGAGHPRPAAAVTSAADSDRRDPRQFESAPQEATACPRRCPPMRTGAAIGSSHAERMKATDSSVVSWRPRTTQPRRVEMVARAGLALMSQDPTLHVLDVGADRFTWDSVAQNDVDHRE